MILTEIGHAEAPCGDTLFQSGFWAAFKESLGTEARCFSVESPLWSGTLAVLVRTSASGERYAYVPRGPAARVDEGAEGQLLENLALALVPALPAGIACVRFDTLFPSPYLDREYRTANGQWKGAPRSELRELRMNFGTSARSLRKAPVDHLCPDTVIVDLSADDDELLARMRSTTRNCVRRSLKGGVDYRVRGAEWVPEWHRIYRDTARRKGFFHEGLAYFERLFAFARDGLRADDPEFIVLSACKDGLPLAGIVLGVSGTRGHYLYAGSTTEARELMPNYGLQWEAMRLLRERGCVEYDLMGVPPNGDPNHSMYGLYTFKTGLGGRIVHYSGCWDFPVDERGYARMANAENMGIT